MKGLEGRVAVVTGAGRGIGRAHALRLARAGATVLVADLGVDQDGGGATSDPAEAVCAEIIAAGGKALADTSDVGFLAGGRALVERTLEQLGRIDILVNNAGLMRGGGEIAAPVETEFDRLLGVHFKGALGTMSVAIPDMQARGWGRVINTVSEVALDARFPGAGYAYGVAKAAIWSATLAAAHETRGSGVTVNAISPGARTRVNESLLDAGFRGQPADLDLRPEHVAEVAAWLCSDEAADVSGRILHAAGGQVREYQTTRSKTDLALRVVAAIGPA